MIKLLYTLTFLIAFTTSTNELGVPKDELMWDLYSGKSFIVK